MTKDKVDYRALLASLEDDPFLNNVQETQEERPGADLEADSIFSVAEEIEEVSEGEGRAASPTAVPPPEATPPVAKDGQEGGQASASPMPQPPSIRDAVLQHAVQQGLMTVHQVALLMKKAQAHAGKVPLWRFALMMPEAPREEIMTIAARVYKIPFAHLDQNPAYMLGTTLSSLPLAFRQQCFALGLLPFAYVRDEQAGHFMLKLACADPFLAKVRTFVNGLQMETQLCYAPRSVLEKQVQALKRERAVEAPKASPATPAEEPPPPAEAPAVAPQDEAATRPPAATGQATDQEDLAASPGDADLEANRKRLLQRLGRFIKPG